MYMTEIDTRNTQNTQKHTETHRDTNTDRNRQETNRDRERFLEKNRGRQRQTEADRDTQIDRFFLLLWVRVAELSEPYFGISLCSFFGHQLRLYSFCVSLHIRAHIFWLSYTHVHTKYLVNAYSLHTCTTTFPDFTCCLCLSIMSSLWDRQRQTETERQRQTDRYFYPFYEYKYQNFQNFTLDYPWAASLVTNLVYIHSSVCIYFTHLHYYLFWLTCCVCLSHMWPLCVQDWSLRRNDIVRWHAWATHGRLAWPP